MFEVHAVSSRRSSPRRSSMRTVSRPSLLLLCAVFVGGGAVGQRFDHHAVRGRQPAGGISDRLEGEFLPLHGSARVQGMEGFGPDWSGDAHVLWDGTVGARMETAFPVERAGRYRLALQLTSAPDYGRFTARLDGEVLREGIDLFSGRVELAPRIDCGEFDFVAGEHALVFELTGAHPRARALSGGRYLLGLDFVELQRLDGEAEAAKSEERPTAEAELVAAPRAALSLVEARPLLERYCLRCHGGEDETEGDVDLHALRTRQDLLARPELIRLAADVVVHADMPPDDELQPSADERALLGRFFEALVAEAAAAAELAPVTMRRLNRYEYNNAVRDLLHLKGDVYALPEKVVRGHDHFDPASGQMPRNIRVSNRTLGKNQIEQKILTGVDPFAIDLQAEHGFNNRGEELSTSTILLESLLRLGRSIPEAPEFDGYTELFETFFQPGQGSVSARLQPFLERAFRRPADAETLARYVAFHAREWERTGSYTQAMKGVVGAVLASPKFCFVVETAASGDGHAPLDGYELAQRLALFLWSSIPDDELLVAARDGRLAGEAGIRAEVERMLLDPKCRALAENFARQWLRLDQLVTAVPDFDRFENYYSRIGCEQWKFGLQSMIEPLLLFESVLVEDRSILVFVDSDYSYRSDELEAWYRRPDDPFAGKGNHGRFGTGALVFRRRTLPTRREGGVITTAATLTMTSTPLRTSPIKRGAWVATAVLNDPPPPPPDAVPEIEADDAALAEAGLTIRERLKQHAVQQDCASCHSRIDPLGFALENYDPVGHWRDVYRGELPIDASGELFGEARFTTIEEFKEALLDRPERFVRAFTEHLLSYALGRELVVGDEPAVDRIVERALAKGARISVVVTEIALSVPFRNKASQERSR